MPKLKDYFVSDMDTFLNQDEFAEIHDINGQNIPCIVDRDVLKQRVSEGVYSAELVLFVKETDLGYRPVTGQHLRLDNELYLVYDCAENAGMLEITLEANRA